MYVGPYKLQTIKPLHVVGHNWCARVYRCKTLLRPKAYADVLTAVLTCTSFDSKSEGMSIVLHISQYYIIKIHYRSMIPESTCSSFCCQAEVRAFRSSASQGIPQFQPRTITWPSQAVIASSTELVSHQDEKTLDALMGPRSW